MIRPLTIVHTEGSRRWGGQETRVLEECRWMRDHGHHVVIIGPAESTLARRAVTFGLEHRSVPFLRVTFAGDLRRVRRLLHDLRPQVLNTHGNLDSKAAQLAAAGLRIPLVIRTRHSIPPVARTIWNRLLYCKLCHLVLTTAECSAQQLIRDLKVPADRVVTVPSGIRPPASLPNHVTAREQLNAELQIPAAVRVLGYVGRLRIAKGLDDLLAAFGHLTKRVPDCHLVLVGDGPDLETLRQQANRLSLAHRVHFVGHREDPWPYYCAFDGHVLATPEHEGVSQALRQAMFAGCPVVATEVGGSTEIIRDGDTGLLVPPASPLRLAEALEQTLLDPKASAARASRARAYVESYHTIEHMGQRLLTLYAQHLQPTRHPRRKASVPESSR